MNKGKIYSLQALRGIAFLGVFGCHVGFIDLGAWGVSVFFILSGFVMYYKYNDKELKCGILKNLLFSIRKIRKLYFLHIITMIFALLIDKFSIREIVLNILLVQTWVPDTRVAFSLNSVAWYLSVSFFLYFLFPYILCYIRNKGGGEVSL